MRSYGLASLSGLVLAAVLVVVGHVDPNDDLDPWQLTVSDFAVSDRGGVTDVAMGVTALATLVLLLGLRRAGIRAGALATGLFAGWTGGLLLAAVVPTDEPGLALSLGGQVHRYASVVAFLALPAGGWLLARRLPAAAGVVRRLVLASVFLAGAMALAAGPGDRFLVGLAERLLIVAETGLLGAVAVVLARREFGSRRAGAVLERENPVQEVAVLAQRDA